MLRNTCPEFKKLIKMIKALVWVPSEEVVDYWMAIKHFCVGKLYMVDQLPPHECYPTWQKNLENLEKFLQYITHTWVGDAAANRQPNYSPRQWSGERTLLDDKVPSTQGGNEAYNHHFRM